MNSVFINLYRILKPDAALNIIIANNVVRNIEIPVVDIMIELLENIGFIEVNHTERAIQQNRRRYPYGITGFRGLMNTEYIVKCRK